MIRSKLRILMAQRRVRSFSELARSTGLHRVTLSRIADDLAERFDREALDALCAYFQCQPGDLLEYVPDTPPDAPDGTPAP